jgi:hypothetical protein
MPKGKPKDLCFVDTIVIIVMAVILSFTVVTMLVLDIINGG